MSEDGVNLFDGLYESVDPIHQGDYDTDFANPDEKIVEETPERTVKKIYYDKPEGGRGYVKIVETEKRIATICEVKGYDDKGRAQLEVEEFGMGYEEICRHFPPSSNSNKDYCLSDLLRSIIWEAYTKEDSVDPGNVRHFWYTHLKYVIRNELGLGESDSVKNAINNAWKKLINSGLISYEEMNITSAKENVRKSYVTDSPFSNIIIATEKEDLYEDFEWIPELFNCTLITAGGQPSRSVAEHFIQELKENGIDLDQKFYMCTISDYDPAGYYIQKAFRDQFELQMKKYGGSGSIEIIRLFVNPDQVTEELVELQGMDYEDSGAISKVAKKSEQTKWETFCKFTDGGLYEEVSTKSFITEDDGEWTDVECLDCGVSMLHDGQDYYCQMCDTVYRPQILELDAFGNEFMEQAILDEVLEIINKTNDESMAMIPEIMRVFDKQRQEVIDELYEKHKEDWLEPIIQEYLDKVEQAKRELRSEYWNKEWEEEDRFEDEKEPIERKYDRERDRVGEHYNSRIEAEYDAVADELERKGWRQEIERIEEQIQELEERRKEIESKIMNEFEPEFSTMKDDVKKCQEELAELDEDGEDEIRPIREEHEERMEKLRQIHQKRQGKLEDFEDEKRAEFNPVEYNLKENIEQVFRPENIPVEYRDIEFDNRTQEFIADMMTRPDKLLEEGVSAWNQTHIPVFEEDDLLTKASQNKDRTVERYRRGFVPKFLEGMRQIIKEKGDEDEIEYPEVPEMESIEEELEERVEEIKEEYELEVE